MTIDVLENGRLKIDGCVYVYHHTSLFRGYVSRRNWCPKPYYYCGKYGEGVIVERPNYDSSRYSFRDYYLFEERLG